jgi:hypothetical protein
MAFQAGKWAEITVNTKALSAFCDTADINVKLDTADTTTFTATWKTYIGGLLGGTVTLAGDYDPTVTTGPASVLWAAITGGVAVPCIFYPSGNRTGQGTSHTFNALITDYKEASKTTAQVTFAATLLITGSDVVAQL